MSLEHALAAAVDAARAAGAHLRADLHRKGGPRGAGTHADADEEAERLIRHVIFAACPDWGYLGEETGQVAGRPGAPVWLVDPNDGTVDYLVGRRGSAVSIGAVKEGRPILGVVYAFAYPDDRGDLFAWAEGGPLLRNGAPVTTALALRLTSDSIVLVSSRGDRDPDGNLENAEPARYRSVPSIAHRLALVAAGEGAAATALVHPGDWDYGGGHALVSSKGGVLLDEAGRPVTYAADGTSTTGKCFGGAPAVAAALAARPWDVHAGKWGEERPVALEKGEAVVDPGLLSRAQGCLLGQIAGDNLGALVEFQSGEEVRGRYPDGPRRLADGGVWTILAGQPTDDGEMALALARSIVTGRAYEPARALAAYRDWIESGPFDVGRATRAALARAPDPASQANGSLMRASPLGILAHAWPRHEAVRIAREDGALTHPNPVCRDAVAAFVVAVAHAIARGDGARAAHEAAVGWTRDAGAEPAVAEALRRAATEAPVLDSGQEGWVLRALQNAFHALLHADSLEEGVVATVRRGGDTDTNAAIAGALLGAVHGREAVPAQWRTAVLSCRPTPKRARHPRPMRFWPVDVLEIAERLLLAGRPEAARQTDGAAIP